MSANSLTCVGMSVLLCRHSAICSVVSASNTCMAAGSPPVPRLGSNATMYILSLTGVLYQRTCPVRRLGSTPSRSSNLVGAIKVSSLITNSHSISLRNRSSPSCASCSRPHCSSLSGCSRQLLLNARNPLIPSTVVLPCSSSVLLAPFHRYANWSSSEFGVDVIMALPPVAKVGEILVQNSLAMVGRTNANSSAYNSEILIPRPVVSVVVCATIRDPFSNSKLFLL